MKRSVLLVVLAGIAVLVALALFVGRDPRASEDDARSAARASGPAPANDVGANAPLTGAAEPSAPADASSTETSARAPIESGAFRSATSTNAATGVIRGRVLVGGGHSPQGLAVRLRLAIPSREAVELDADGAFEFTDLTARTYELEASGLDDVVWRPERYRIQLQRGQVLDLDWDLSDRCPALVDVQVLFDGLPTASSIEPWVADMPRNPLLVSDAAGRARLRSLGAGAALHALVTNHVRGAEPPEVLRVGQPLEIATLEPCTQRALAVDVRTSLVRVLAAEDGARPEAVGGGRVSCSLFADDASHAPPPGQAPLYWLGKLELEPSRTPLATFRAGPGRYSLETIAKDGEWVARIVVTKAGEAVDCRLERR
ncbi:MAG: hypothetical protein EPO68_06920 [Planctomycetota bacterium]|nr:MAG: hypothetical protein EPO68_06920 [Planctomycetota bacterium]